MRIIDKGSVYKVYMLTFPNGKRYIGYTGEPNIETRIAKGYNHNRRISKVLKEDTRQLKIDTLADNLTKQAAEQQEIYFISLYNTTNRRKGYNYSTGGAAGRKGCKLTAKQRAPMSGDNNPNRQAAARKKLNRAFKIMERALNYNPAAVIDNFNRALDRLNNPFTFDFDIQQRINEVFSFTDNQQ